MNAATKTKKGLGVQFAEQIIEEGKRPMSPDQIKGKYQLGFPFTVKRVIQGANSEGRFTGAPQHQIGVLITFIGYDASGGYCTHGDYTIQPDSERFVYHDGGV